MVTLHSLFVAKSGEGMLVEKAERIRKERNKQNIKSRKYGQVKLRASKRGMYSCLFALGCLVCLGGLIYAAYVTYGAVPSFVGSIGLITVINAGCGIYYGIMGFKERERSYITCKLGILANSMVVLLFVLLFIRGLFS